MALSFESLEKALKALDVALRVYERVRHGPDTELADTARSGVVQNFEVAYEQSWKLLRRWLTEELGYPETELAMRRHLFRVAAKHQLVDDPQAWMDFHQARNLTSHTYDLAIAQQVAHAAAEFAHTGHALLARLKQAAQDGPSA